MVGDELTNLESKVNSAEANTSTSQSTHSKQKNKKSGGQHKREDQRQCEKDNAQVLEQNDQIKPSKVDEQMQNRLFTFMDQKDCQKKFIQNFFFNQSNRHHNLSDQQSENNMLLLSKANEGIQKIAEYSKKKREMFLKKLFNGDNKQSKSVKRLSNINKPKTPKKLCLDKQKYETIDTKKQEKTPKINPNRSMTPKYEKQRKLFGAKNSLENNLLNIYDIKQKKQIKQVELKRQRYQIRDDSIKINPDTLAIKTLLKKKKQLEIQLLQINSSLICRKKKTSIVNPDRNKKTINVKNIQNRKKSILKLPKGDCKYLM